MKIGFLGLLTIVFVIFKIIGYINWSWLLVFSPVLIGIGIWVVIGLILGLLWFFSWICYKIKK